MTLPSPWRRTSQVLMPAKPERMPAGRYDVYPGFDIGSGRISLGYAALARRLATSQRICIDGFPGVLWEHLRDQLDAELRAIGVRATWVDARAAMRPEHEIEARVAPFLGGSDPIFGFRFDGTLADFFNPEKLRALQPLADAGICVIYGTGAALAGWDATLVYVDVPKNEIQFRSRAGSVNNLGRSAAQDAKAFYKRAYFVDWVAAGRHKAALLPRMDVMVDSQRPDDPASMEGTHLRAALARMSRSVFRVRPWFEPGPWGGQWIKRHMPQLPQDAPNYAWSFELIVPENGLALESDGRLLEVSFDTLMFHDHRAVLGDSAERFGHEFPIRFDFLDTFAGGNLSLQCHPRPEYIRRHFGETITQDETYYILDSGPNAQVYLGFRENVDPIAFRAALDDSFAHGTQVEVERFINTEPARKHDLFLIPNGTVHCSGVDNLVLEISATPYIFTFKMYDWLRLDLDGRPRPINIQRAFDNLYFERQGARATRELVSKQTVLRAGADWQLVHCPTHPQHFYDVHRFEFSGSVDASTDGSCHVLSLVEGDVVLLETASGARQRFSYAETFVIPAAAGHYRLISEDGRPLKVIKAFLKPQADWTAGSVP